MRIIITGAADGLGREIAAKLKGNQLILIDYDEEKLKVAAKENRAKHYVCDITKVEQINSTCKDILASNDQIDVLINCAGAWVNESDKTNLNDYKNMILVNLFGTIAMTKSFIPKFKSQKKGLIINVNSMSGVECEEKSPVYGATGAGLSAFRKNIKRDLSKNGVKITDIHPGLIQTKLFEKAGVKYSDEMLKSYSLQKCQVANVVKYIIDQPAEVVIPALEIKNIHENL